MLKVDVVTQEQALERARKELGEFKDVFESEFLPASLDVKLKPGFRDPATVRKVVERSRKAYEFVDDVRFGEEWITQLYRLRNIAGVAGVGARTRVRRGRRDHHRRDDSHGGAGAQPKRSRSCVSSARPTDSFAGRS